MGNYEEKKQINEEELRPYLKEGLTMNDLVNLKKAFISLDKDENGKIEYDIRKITDIDKYDLPVKDENGKVLISYDQFMNIMTENIIKNREKFGNNVTTYESETDTVMCIICPFKK
jgi:Ca2+-binding EF-hand superfamily protein